jgi:hypothetical protein
MNKEFIPYKEALALKELGFDEPCVGYYRINDTVVSAHPQFIQDFVLVKQSEFTSDKCFSAPLYQQAFRWFREKHSVDSHVKKDWDNGKLVGYEGTLEEDEGYIDCGTFATHAQAELACLRKLIEIVKKQKL